MVDEEDEGKGEVTTVDFTGKTLGELVKERLGRARVFEKYGLDYFCGGNESLEYSCTTRGLDVAEVVQALTDESESQSRVVHADWSKQTLQQLVDHIEDSHNRYLKRELPRLLAVIDGLRKSYGKPHPELTEIRDIFRNLTMELGIHVLNDERLLFPICRNSSGARGGQNAGRTDIKTLVGVIQAGNESVAAAMKKIRELTNNYVFPANVGNSYKFMLQALRGLESDLHLHIHEENNILFPILLTEDFSPKLERQDRSEWM